MSWRPQARRLVLQLVLVAPVALVWRPEHTLGANRDRPARSGAAEEPQTVCGAHREPPVDCVFGPPLAAVSRTVSLLCGSSAAKRAHRSKCDGRAR